nr:hypothetical protein GCM10020063_053630 [Dactylosporangium thailandense]
MGEVPRLAARAPTGSGFARAPVACSSYRLRTFVVLRPENHGVSDDHWRLRQLEQSLSGEDPELARALTALRPVRRWRTRLATGALLSAGCALPASLMAHDTTLAVLSAGAFGVAAGLWQPLDT